MKYRLDRCKYMKNLFITLFMIISVSLAGEIVLQETVLLTEREVGISIDCDSNKMNWAAYTLTKSKEFLKGAEVYTGVPYPGPDEIVIRGSDTVISEDPGSPLYGQRVGGSNLWNLVALEYNLSPVEQPALLFHELTHYWFGYSERFGNSEVSWLIEGMASYLTPAMADEKILQLSSQEYESVFNHWGFIYTKRKDDPALNRDFRKDGPFSYYYSKSFKLIFLIHKLLGSDTFRLFIMKLLQKSTILKSNEDILTLLNSLKTENWRENLSGWVLPGRYTLPSPGDFSDPDNDTLLSVEEFFLKSDPEKSDSDGDLLPDGLEVERGLNPLVKDSDVIEIIESEGPFIDGSMSEWNLFPWYTLSDTIGEATGPDFKSLKVLLKEDILYIAAEVNNTMITIPDTIFDILVDFDGDKQSDREFAFFMNDNRTWTYSQGVSQSDPDIKGGIGTEAEITIPLKYLPGEGFYIMPLFHNIKTSENYDVWDSWIYLKPDWLKSVNYYRLQSNLRDDDFDGDLIPDRWEIELGLNPLEKDSLATVKQYAPFPDGKESDWSVLNLPVISGKKEKGLWAIDSLQYSVKNGFLCFMIKITTPLQAGKNVMFDILMDLNNDGRHDYEWAFLFIAPENPWMYSVKDGKSFYPENTFMAYGDVLEVMIPLEVIPAENLRVFPVIRDLEKGVNYDEFSHWIKIDAD